MYSRKSHLQEITKALDGVMVLMAWQAQLLRSAMASLPPARQAGSEAAGGAPGGGTSRSATTNRPVKRRTRHSQSGDAR